MLTTEHVPQTLSHTHLHAQTHSLKHTHVVVARECTTYYSVRVCARLVNVCAKSATPSPHRLASTRQRAHKQILIASVHTYNNLTTIVFPDKNVNVSVCAAQVCVCVPWWSCWHACMCSRCNTIRLAVRVAKRNIAVLPSPHMRVRLILLYRRLGPHTQTRRHSRILPGECFFCTCVCMRGCAL